MYIYIYIYRYMYKYTDFYTYIYIYKNVRMCDRMWSAWPNGLLMSSVDSSQVPPIWGWPLHGRARSIVTGTIALWMSFTERTVHFCWCLNPGMLWAGRLPGDFVLSCWHRRSARTLHIIAFKWAERIWSAPRCSPSTQDAEMGYTGRMLLRRHKSRVRAARCQAAVGQHGSPEDLPRSMWEVEHLGKSWQRQWSTSFYIILHPNIS